MKKIFLSVLLAIFCFITIPASAACISCHGDGGSEGLTIESPMEISTMKMKNIIPTTILGAAAVTATANGAGVDVSDFAGPVKFTLDSSAGGGGDHTLDAKLQESDDNVTFTDVVGGAFTQVTNAAAAFETLTINGDGLKQYVRGVDTIAGTSPTFSRSLSMIGQKLYS